MIIDDEDKIVYVNGIACKEVFYKLGKRISKAEFEGHVPCRYCSHSFANKQEAPKLLA